MKQAIIGIFIAWIAFSCDKPKQEQETVGYSLQGDTIFIPPNSAFKAKLKTALVQKEPYHWQMLSPGTVKVIPTQYAEIASPFAGRLTRSYLRLGMKTTPETPLFEISSPDFMAAQKVFFQEKSQLEQARKTLKRQKDLLDNGVGTQKDFEEAQTAYEIEKTEYNNAATGIKLFKADPDKMVLGQPLVVRSPIAGEVIENKAVLGQFIKDDASSIATIAELSKIWIAGQIKEKDLRFIHKLDECHIEMAAFPEKIIKAKVFHIDEIVDEETRSVRVLIEAGNADHTLKPGMYVTVNFTDKPVNLILIPSKAIFQMSDASFVFVKVAENKYLKRKIEIADTQENKIVVKSGLEAGETIITEGGFLLSGAK
ncbi:membrane fusion protein, cobalt-zinc-cadmium efflux system [Pseudarcicella hirudinis]|uniref:Membrane fusion protein, cobalt-zinc-cadmium efflux system n=1 Tax=Pseudarcicella hirudinis TaxID=1079859 RepID=A0A1I5YN11_9BACT|nr:efflux RND transporter periplasmic adaptor subunit [Pseudarcicella hirudinis]SFQ45641.1 membrane fusion protein, cobalt-zinc-cadmium efflux system [Pseudarcicella hirudinis]